ncbi:hypothetical protein CBL_11626 [Carabus blaptoides fortunei]
MYVCSLYCTFGSDINYDIEYLERVVEAAGSSPLIVGPDANAVSNMWFSKGDLRYGDKVQRGALLEDFVGQQKLSVMNCPSPYYTFSSRGGSSDIDVSLGNRTWDNLYCYEEALRDRADLHIVEINNLSVAAIAETPGGWITGASDDDLKRKKRTRLRRRGDEYRESLWVYKKRLKETKEAHWQAFVSEQGEGDPWRVVHHLIGRKSNGGSEIVGPPQIETARGVADSWDASANMLLATFFPGVGDTDEQRQQQVQQLESRKQDGREFSWGELRSAVYSMAVGKAPGLDDLDVRCSDMSGSRLACT